MPCEFCTVEAQRRVLAEEMAAKATSHARLVHEARDLGLAPRRRLTLREALLLAVAIGAGLFLASLAEKAWALSVVLSCQ